MRELNINEIEHVSGGGFWTFVRDAFVGDAIVTAGKWVWNGPGPVSSSTANFGVVGGGSNTATNPSSAGAVNGTDSQSDDSQQSQEDTKMTEH